MDRGTNGKNINVPAKSEWQYNWQFVTFVAKYRFKVFKNPKTQDVVRNAIQEIAGQLGVGIREFCFGDDYSHIHMEIDVPNKHSVSHVIQALKSHSASKVFQEMPNYKLRYPRGSFWGYQYGNESVGKTTEETIQNYIRKQDVSHQRPLFN